jgi:hypothetical protein
MDRTAIMEKPNESDEGRLVGESLRFYAENTFLYAADSEKIEPLSQETFSALIECYQEANKSLLVAVVKNRDPERPSCLHNFYFHAFHLNKILFKLKPNGELLSRFDKSSPLPAMNPLTNLPIVGEVEYYIVRRKDRADFIGTDFTYTMNANLRQVFVENALRPEDVQFRSYSSNADDINRFSNLDDPSLVAIERVIEERRNNQAGQVKVPFKHAALFGIILVVYYGLLGLALSIAGNKVLSIQFIDAFYGRVNKFSLAEIVQIAILPVVSNGFDKYVLKLYKTVEDKVFFYTKVAAWVVLAGAIGLSYTTDSLIAMMACSGMIIGYTVFYNVFSLSLYFANSSFRKLV